MSRTEYKLGYHCGITFAGIKTASLVWFSDGEKRELRDFEARFARRGFVFEELKRAGERTLFYIYHKSKLEKALFDGENRAFLEKRGYVYDTVEEAVRILRRRMAEEDFPHEVGIFLGYPVEDVAGFVSSPDSGYLFCGYWKVYENPAEKLRLFDRYKKCSECIVAKMRGGTPLTAIFNT